MSINLFPIVIASILGMLVGAVWYSPVMFAKPWMELTKLSEKDLKKFNMSRMYVTMFVSTFIMAYILAYFIGLLKIDSVLGGVFLGFLIWLGFSVTSLLPLVLFEHRPWKLFVLNAGHQLAVLLVMGAVLGVWK